MRLNVYYFGCDFSDCCPHLYCGELKNHNQNNTHQASSKKFRQIISNQYESDILQKWRQKSPKGNWHEQ